MFKKGRKREAKGLAVVYFFIGLIILLIILAVIYFALKELDYSDMIRNPDATIRSYVEVTPEPDTFEDEDDQGPDALDVDLTETTPTPSPSPTPTPTPAPTPEPTPTPTPLPPTMLAQARTSGFTLPGAAPETCRAELTKCVVSVGDNNRVLYLAGYAYLDEATFDGANSQCFLVVSQPKTNQLIAYQMTMRAGISGVPHDGAKCKNPTSADFEVSFDVSQLYTGDIYNLGVVIGYRTSAKGKARYVYYAFPADVNFTVLDGQVVEAVRVGGAAAPVADPDYEGEVADVDDDDDDDDVGLAAGNTLDAGASTGAIDTSPLNNPASVATQSADMAPTPTPVSPFVTQDPAVVQQQLMDNQMGIG